MPLTLDILEMGARGDGVAEQDGERYFVPFSLPGEVVSAEPVGKRRDGVAAELLEVLSPSRHRETPSCAHFGTCGGCGLQHWRRDVYSAWKVGLIERALKQRGVEAPAFEPMMASAPGERRRADFVVRRQGKGVVAGFHQRASERVVDIRVCVIAWPTLTALLGPLRTALADVLPDGAAADVVANQTDGGLDVLVRPHKRLDLTFERRQAVGRLVEQANACRVSWGDRSNAEIILTSATPLLALGEIRVTPPPGAFLQATKRGEQAMRAAVQAWIGDAPKIADLFAGVGSLSLGHSERPRVTLFESDRPSVDAVEKASRLFSSHRFTANRRDLFRNPLAEKELDTFDAVLLDPARAGAAAQVGELARSKVARVVYASCDPGTFSRDARVLQDGRYRLEKLKPIDQFLWSGHVELIALFSRQR